MKLRSHLYILMAGTLLPMIVFAVIAAVVLVERERATFRRGATDRTLALVTAVDAELRSSITALEALATSVNLDGDDLRVFHAEALRVLKSQPDWFSINLADHGGQQVINVLKPYGSPLPTILERPSFEQVLDTGKPAVSNLAVARFVEEHAFAVRVAVTRRGMTKYVLSAVVKPEAISRLLSAQRLPPDWVGVVLDSNHRFVARTVKPEASLGQLASESLRAALARSPEGWFHGRTIEGTDVYTPYTRSSYSGWTVAMGIPAAVVDTSMRRMTWTIGGGVLSATALAFILAILLGRRISKPIVALASAAKAIGRGDRPEPPGTARVDEVGDLGRALEEAGTAVRDREAGERLARVEAETANRAKDEFLAVLSHELRTPLNAMYGWARMLQKSELPAERTAHALDVITRNAGAQIQLIEDLLDVSRIVTGKMRLDVCVVDLHAVVEAALDAIRLAAAAKEIQLQCVLDPRVGGVSGDPNRLQQVVWNLLNNAVKFTPKGGRVSIDLQRINSHAEIVVTDTGQGIRAETLPHIFERFRQADSTTTRAHPGLGLGLALVRHLIELHGGTVTADSAGEGKGARFVVKLPVAATLPTSERETTARVHPTASALPPREILPPSLHKRRVLVVDDDRDNLDLMGTVIARNGGEVRLATSASEGFRIVQEWRPDVLISDIGMPDEDGYSFIAKVRSLDVTQGGKTPAVAVTAYGRLEDRLRTLSAGYSMHVSKPVDPDELATVVASLANR
jgi:signal transduction histidine kinase/CheY-like chemotaxis protein